MSRTAVAILSTENLLHNVAVLRKKAGKAKLIAMVKANAYGHGLRSVASRLENHVDFLGVASIDEAMALRKHGIKSEIILFEGVFESNELILAATEGFHVACHDPCQIQWIEKLNFPLPLKIWLKVNTGLGRLGFSIEEVKSYYERLKKHPHVSTPIRLMSHFACADTPDHPLNEKQLSLFKKLIQEIPTEYSLCNSAGIFNFPEAHYDFVRPGLSLYGASPLQGVSASELGLKPVMTLQSSLIAVRQMKKGETIGYGARYCCPESMPVGIIALGYGDGYPINAKDSTPVLVNTIKCGLVGRVSMDMMAVDLRPCPQATVGDPVTLWGQGLPIEDVVPHVGHINYSLLTGIQHRVRFLWTRP